MDKSNSIDQFCVMDGSYNLPSNVWSLEKLLKDCDYICNVLPKTPQTNNILGKGKLEFCKGIYMFDLLIANCQSKILQCCRIVISGYVAFFGFQVKNSEPCSSILGEAM